MLNATSPRHPPPPSAPPRHAVPAAPPRGALLAGALLLLTAVVLGLILRGDGPPFFQGFDDRWMEGMNGSRQDAATDLAIVFDRLGGPLGQIITLAFAGCLCVYGRWRSAVFVFTSAAVTNMLVVLPLKSLADRPRPSDPWVLVNDGSFPSGQVSSAATLVVVVAVVVFPPRARLWWWLFGIVFVAAMMWSRTWLHAQWPSDTVAGALAGAGTGLLLWRAFAPLLDREAVRAAAGRLWD
ncbi:phosphatase PAP2 family protein [Streptomyces sp. A3M-1-3]|uniref:phosphatase PAP2 family protein n=1 Tax=Streptomyces sp. A3M-1-3 TaxID=2962044 RepID=UPI0020B7C551|nr:phosphatase PAP2 family protein [Streptomyces sp. A3M-1-3]MCP3818491.1 phosphatase PAP2 family protein [Streptomyces sp. A3M-1-3]